MKDFSTLKKVVFWPFFLISIGTHSQQKVYVSSNVNDKNNLKTILEAIDSLNNCAQACKSHFSAVYNFTLSLWPNSGGEVPNFFRTLIHIVGNCFRLPFVTIFITSNTIRS